MKTCPKCTINHNKNGAYCSRACANSRVSTEEVKLKQRNSVLLYWSDKRKRRQCSVCQSQFIQKKYEKRCLDCVNNTNYQKKNKDDVEIIKEIYDPIKYTLHLIETGKIHELSEYSIRRRIKAYLIHIHGKTCMICGISTWCEKPVPLVCDHIDGDSNNSVVDNFRIICCNCDALLPTYKSKNRGKGRIYDREYRRRKSMEDTEVGSSSMLETCSVHANG